MKKKSLMQKSRYNLATNVIKCFKSQQKKGPKLGQNRLDSEYGVQFNVNKNHCSQFSLWHISNNTQIITCMSLHLMESKALIEIQSKISLPLCKAPVFKNL